MKAIPTTAQSQHRGTLDDFLAPEDIVPVPSLTEEQWNTLRRVAGRELAWRFATLRNLWVHRGRLVADALGFAWGGIYRTLLVGSIVATSYRNEGLFRAGERIQGTGDFFRGGFLLARSSNEFREIARLVNLRHHVAGVVVADADGGYRVIDGYEADYAYVATAFIEAIRRGLATCGLPPDSPRGRALGEQVCTVLYQVAGFTGLRRIPRDLAAHERFRDAYDRHLRERPASARVQRMAREIARRIVPVTAVLADEKVADHIRRHLDPETAGYLFPEAPGADLEAQRDEWMRRHRARKPIDAIRARSAAREAIWKRPDVAALRRAYEQAASDSTDDRLIGAILLHAIDTGGDAARPLERRAIDLADGEALIRQGETVGEMYVVLSSTASLVVLQHTDAGAEPRQVATLAAPIVLGEIGMWRGQPAVATVLSRGPNRLDVLVIDAERFESLKQEPGFRAATAAEVQRRLALNTALTGTQLEDAAARSGDARLASIAQLFRYLTGDSHVALDAVIDLPHDATPVECVEALRRQVDAAIAAGGLEPDLVRYLQQVVTTIG
ncbi:MAG: cyclic nucleotide-binding domain-containing protein [Planctomycetia bacterium]